MPPYEMAVITKAVASRPQTVSILKRVCENIWKGDGIVKKLENLGIKELPYSMKTKDNKIWRKGHYFIMDVDMSVDKTGDILKDIRKDYDIIRSNVVRRDMPFIRPCATGPCQFGEVSVNEKARKTWKSVKLKKTQAKTST